MPEIPGTMVRMEVLLPKIQLNMMQAISVHHKDLEKEMIRQINAAFSDLDIPEECRKVAESELSRVVTHEIYDRYHEIVKPFCTELFSDEQTLSDIRDFVRREFKGMVMAEVRSLWKAHFKKRYAELAYREASRIFESVVKEEIPE